MSFRRTAAAVLLAAAALACAGSTSPSAPGQHEDADPAGVLASLPLIYTDITPRLGGGFQSEMFLTMADTGTPHSLGTGSTPVWSPDGQHIAFIDDPVGDDGITRHGLYVMAADGSGPRPVTDDHRFESYPEWSPDGTQLVYSATLEPGNPDHRDALWVVGADGSGLRLLAADSTASYRAPSWSPDGQRIAFVRDSAAGANRTLWLVDADGTDARAVPQMEGRVYQPEWSPDGQWLAMAYQLADDEKYIALLPTTQHDVVGPPTRLLAHPGGWPAWSPAGTQLLYIRGGGSNGPELWTVGTDGSAATRVRTLLGNWGDW